MKGDSQFDQSQLIEYAEKQLAREVEMLRWTGSFLAAFHTATLSSENIDGEIAAALRQSSLESFAMHSRNLIDFLYLRNHYRRDRSNDIVIEDYDLFEPMRMKISDVLPPLQATLLLWNDAERTGSDAPPCSESQRIIHVIEIIIWWDLLHPTWEPIEIYTRTPNMDQCIWIEPRDSQGPISILFEDTGDVNYIGIIWNIQTYRVALESMECRYLH